MVIPVGSGIAGNVERKRDGGGNVGKVLLGCVALRQVEAVDVQERTGPLGPSPGAVALSVGEVGGGAEGWASQCYSYSARRHCINTI